MARLLVVIAPPAKTKPTHRCARDRIDFNQCGTSAGNLTGGRSALALALHCNTDRGKTKVRQSAIYAAMIALTAEPSRHRLPHAFELSDQSLRPFFTSQS